MAGINQPQDAVFVHDEVAAELGCVVAVRVEEFAALEPAFDINPHYARMMRAQARAFESVGLIYSAVAVK